MSAHLIRQKVATSWEGFHCQWIRTLVPLQYTLVAVTFSGPKTAPQVSATNGCHLVRLHFEGEVYSRILSSRNDTQFVIQRNEIRGKEECDAKWEILLGKPLLGEGGMIKLERSWQDASDTRWRAVEGSWGYDFGSRCPKVLRIVR
jgi:hypothetical protein